MSALTYAVFLGVRVFSAAMQNYTESICKGDVSQKILSLRLLFLTSYTCVKQRVNGKRIKMISLCWDIWDEEWN